MPTRDGLELAQATRLLLLGDVRHCVALADDARGLTRLPNALNVVHDLMLAPCRTQQCRMFES